VSPPRQGVFLWEVPRKQEFSQAIQQRCQELLSRMLLAAVSTAANPEEESDEREDTTGSY
jgi:hypothetical protein